MAGPDDEETITYKSIELKDSKTIELKVNNSDGGSFENSMQAAIMMHKYENYINTLNFMKIKKNLLSVPLI